MADFLARDLSHVSFHKLVGPDKVPFSSVRAFFSLHNAEDVVLYISEVVVANASAHFGVVSLPDLGRRCYRLRLKLWIEHNSAYALFYSLYLDLRNLILLGRGSLDVELQLCPNSVVWSFHDLLYCLPSDYEESEWVKSRTTSWSRPHVKKASYTYDDIRHLISLGNGVRDFKLSKEKLSRDVDSVTEELASLEPQENTSQLKFDIHSLHKYITKQKMANDKLLSEVYTKRLHINKILQIIEEDFPSFKEICTERLEIVKSQIAPLYESLNSAVYPYLISTLQEVGAIIQDAFAIELLAATGRFTILGTEFPSSIRDILSICFYGASELHNSLEDDAGQTPEAKHQATIDKINAGLSHIVFLMSTLSILLDIPLKYQMKYVGSTCYVVDRLSPQQLTPLKKNADNLLPNSLKVVYPLHYDARQTERIPCFDNAERKFDLRYPRFEQGLNLLSKNLAILVTGITELYAQYYHDDLPNHNLSNNIPVDCVDNFLWNLQYILLFITAPK